MASHTDEMHFSSDAV